MKANELMIGDWYQWYAEGYYYYFQVTKETFQNDNDTIANFEPIPLTPEVLEKNGFVKSDTDEDMYYWNWRISDDCISYDKKTHKIRIFHTLGGLAFVEPLTYTHELQHALQLCGINKEIQL